MIVTRLEGGLGNQLFQYAIGRALAHKHNTELKMTADGLDENSLLNYYRLGVFGIKENFATPEEMEKLKIVQEKPVDGVPCVFMPEVLQSPDNILLRGFWHSEKYFADIRNILLEEFTLKNPLEKNSAAWKEKILAEKCPVSLHVRHGDYLPYQSRCLRGLVPEEFYFQCVEELKKNFPDIHIFMFSDDPEWMKENLKFDVPAEFVEGCEHAFEEMYLMTLCRHNIISNGTFAWWGAWLNKNPDKKVFAPYPWHVGGWGGVTVIPESWTKIPVNYYSGFPIFLSVIVYVENAQETAKISADSIAKQMFLSYEVIIIDASTDGTGSSFRIYAGDERFTPVKVSSRTGKIEAWNKGLEIARGDYVLFMTVKDFLAPFSLLALTTVYDNFYDESAKLPENGGHVTPEDYERVCSDVVCCTKTVEEDEKASNCIKDIPGRKFSVKIDQSFANISEPTTLTLEKNQAALFLSTGQINNSISSKVFKRKFLNENKIRFNAGMKDEDSIFLFMLNALLATEKITFVPKPLIGKLK